MVFLTVASLLATALAVCGLSFLRGGAGEKSDAESSTDGQSSGKSMMESRYLSQLGVIHKTEYWGTITVGTPAQEFTVIFDTGSGNLILPGSTCTSAPCVQHKRFSLQESSSGVAVSKEGTPASDDPSEATESTIRFGTGEITGTFVKDRVCLGESGGVCSVSNFLATTQETDEPFSACQFDGIMGLGFPDLSMGPGFNMLDDFVDAHSLPKNQFSVFLSDQGSSEITFGGYKEEQKASDILWVPVTLQSYWEIAIQDITFDNTPQGLCKDCKVAVDTGTSMLAGPSDVIAALSDSLNLKSDCSNLSEMPLVGFQIGDMVLNLKPEDYIDQSDSTNCQLSLMELDVPPPKGPIFVFGDPFLRRFLTVYDKDGPSVGFAVARQAGHRVADASVLMGHVKGHHPPLSGKIPSTSTPENGLFFKHSGEPEGDVESSRRGGQGPADDVEPPDTDSDFRFKRAFKALDGTQLLQKRATSQNSLRQAASQSQSSLVSISLKRTKRRKSFGKVQR